MLSLSLGYAPQPQGYYQQGPPVAPPPVYQQQAPRRGGGGGFIEGWYVAYHYYINCIFFCDANVWGKKSPTPLLIRLPFSNMKSISFTKACFCVDWNCAVWLLFAAAVYWTTAAATQQSSLIELSLNTGLPKTFWLLRSMDSGSWDSSPGSLFVVILL